MYNADAKIEETVWFFVCFIFLRPFVPRISSRFTFLRCLVLLWVAFPWRDEYGQDKDSSESRLERFNPYDLTHDGRALCYRTNSSFLPPPAERPDLLWMQAVHCLVFPIKWYLYQSLASNRVSGPIQKYPSDCHRVTVGTFNSPLTETWQTAP